MVKTIFGIATCLGVVWLLIWVFVGVSIFEVGGEAIDEATGTKTEMVSNLRKKLVIDGDTLVIKDYSLMEGTYTLSDGSKIGKTEIEKYKIK